MPVQLVAGNTAPRKTDTRRPQDDQLGRTVIVLLARRAGMSVLAIKVWLSVVDRQCPLVLAASGPYVARGLTALARTELGHSTAVTAARIAATDTSGCETMDTCEASTSVIVAPARSAILRCAAGGMILSSVPIPAQLGSVFQAPGAVTCTARILD